MKPIVIYIDKNSSKITLTKEEFEKYLKDAYDNGYNNGYSDGKINGWIRWDSYPTNQPITLNPLKTTPNRYEITCEAHNAVGE